MLTKFDLDYKILNTSGQAPLLSVAFTDFHPFDLYTSLNENGVHCKCIIDYKKGNRKIHILRFGIPYYETKQRIEQAINFIGIELEKQFEVATPVLAESEPALEVQPNESLSVAVAA